ncbi:ACP S-malonyltransferase [Paenibacillus monticola]|nr:ACP S-malonyltransferase [Paenibacillus monticola]
MKTTLLFPGQGSQYVGMGKFLFVRFESARRAFEEASEALGYSVSRLCFDGSLEELTRTENAQPCILTVSIAAYRVLLENLDIEPYYCAGHSLGEISALTAAGALSFTDAVRLVRLRGRLMQESQQEGEGGMLAVHRLDSSVIEAECGRPDVRGTVAVSNLNGGGQIVISGLQRSLNRISENLTRLGGRVVPLNVSAAFHSPLMKEGAAKFAAELSRIHFQPLRHWVLSNVTALPYPDENFIPALLAEQMVSVVNWQGCMRFLVERETDRMIEIGPGNVLGNMLRREKAASCLIQSTDQEDDWRNLLSAGGRMARGTNYDAYLKAALCAKNYNVIDTASEYMNLIAEPFRELERLASGARKGESEGADWKNLVVSALDKILEIKKTPSLRREDILNRLGEEGGNVHNVQYA